MGESESFSVRGAVETLGRIEGLHEALRRRTSGLTWMIWGIVSPGIFFTYSFWALAAPTTQTMFMFLWMPWIAAGVTATISLWRSAGLVVPGLENRRHGMVTGIVFFVIMNAAFFLVEGFAFPMVEPAVMMAALGIGYVGLGTAGVNCPTREERLLCASAGAVLLFVAVILSAAVPDRLSAYIVFSLVAPMVTGFALFFNGFWLTVRS